MSLKLAAEHLTSGLYDDIATQLKEMDNACLASAEYKGDFHHAIEQWSNNYLYRNKDSSEFWVNICGEMMDSTAGTIISSRGNHYSGKAGESVGLQLLLFYTIDFFW
jgi:hypothetical protein